MDKVKIRTRDKGDCTVMISVFTKQTSSMLIQSFYKNILGRKPSKDESEYWINYAKQHGNNVATVRIIMEAFLNSDEYKCRSIQKLPILSVGRLDNTTKLIIWGTNDYSKLIYLMLTYRTEFSAYIVECFLDDDSILKNLYGLPVKKADELNFYDAKIVMANMDNSIFSKIEIYSAFERIWSNLQIIDIGYLYFHIPDPIYKRVDSPQWSSLLGKDVVIYYSDAQVKENLLNLIEGLNNIFQQAFKKTVNIIATIGNNAAQRVLPATPGQKILITQDSYIDILSTLLFNGIEFADIRLIKYLDPQATSNDVLMKDGDLIIYTMTKVGTISFINSLQEYDFSVKATHFVTSKPLCALKEINTMNSQFDDEIFKSQIDKNIRYAWNLLIDSVYINNYIKKCAKDTRTLKRQRQRSENF